MKGKHDSGDIKKQFGEGYVYVDTEPEDKIESTSKLSLS